MISFFGNLSIKNKMITLIMGVIIITVVVGLAIYIPQMFNSIKQRKIEEATMYTRLIGEYCTTALVFKYPDRAKEVLEKADAIPSIVNAVIYDKDKKEFTFSQESKTFQKLQFASLSENYYFDDNFLHIIEPIRYEGIEYGAIYLKINVGFYQEVSKTLQLVVLMVVFLILLAWFLASRFQKVISRPILNLAQISRKISETKDYSVRVSKGGKDEIGVLQDEFNEMLEVIQSSEKELAASEERFKEIFNAANEAIFIHDAEDGSILDVNQTMLNMYGYSYEEVMQTSDVHSFSSDIPPYTHDEGIKKIKKTLTDGPQVFEWRAKRKNGQLFWEEVTLKSAVIGGKLCILSVVRDIDERKRLQEVIIQSEKMLTVGGLAAGMAHEINNPLAGMIQNAQVLSNRLSNNIPANIRAAEEVGVTIDKIECYMQIRKIPEMLDLILQSGLRAAKIVDNMLNFSRKSSKLFIHVKLSDLLDKSISLSNNDYDLKKKYDFRNIEIVREYDSAVPAVRCEETKIVQVLLNLLKNSTEAMAEGTIEGAPPKIILKIFVENDFATIEVEDNGLGMSKETKEHVFEPFFTTKPVGQGTGLGLSISYFIITEHHNGMMTVESELGKGSKFKIQLPV